MPYQGMFSPKYPEKYVGNTASIVYRSSWERRFFVYCDETVGILQWASEEFSIPYLSPADKRVHRYFPDVWMEVQTPSGKRKYLIEIKPKQQTEIRQVKRKSAKFLHNAMQVAINHAKWNAAQEYSLARGWTFQVLTEDHLFKGATHGRA